MDIEQLLHNYRGMVDSYAKARAERTYLEEWKKSCLALLMKKAAMNGATSAAAQERDALASDEYREILGGLKVAVEDEEKLRYHMKQIEMEVEIWRTKQANQRFEHRSYGN